MEPTDSLDWYSAGLHIVEEGEEHAAAAAAAAEKTQQQEESLSSVIGSAFSDMIPSEDCVMSGLMQQQQQQLLQPPVELQQQQLRHSVLQHTSDHTFVDDHRLHDPQHASRHIIQPTATHQDHAHHHQSVIVQPTVTSSTTGSSYGAHFPSFGLPSTTTASNLFLTPSFMGLSFPEFETSQLQYPVLSQPPPSLDLFDPNHWMGLVDKKSDGAARRPSFTEAIFPQMFGGQGILDFGCSAAAAAAASAAQQQQQQQQHSSLKSDPLDGLYLSPSLPSSLSSPLVPSSSLHHHQAPPTPKGLLLGGAGSGVVGTVSTGGYGGSTVIREAVLDMEKPEDREMTEQECQVCMATTANGLHFGARTCAACAAFFRRSVADAKQYQCKGSQRCTNSAKDGTGYRKICRACRLARCLQIGMQPENVQNKRFRKEDVMPGGIGDLVGKPMKTSIDSLLKMNFNQPFAAMGQMQLQAQSHLHQSAPQSFYC
ncbi:hypothetical protein PMAYCL1PPCAC_03706, partial [Pristionchus mayeri]